MRGRGRVWLYLGVALGIAVAAGRLPFLAGVGKVLADTAERLVASGANRLIREVASVGASRRVVLGFGGLLAVLVPGVASLALVVAARGSLRLRALVGLLIVALGAASYVYEPSGKATGVLVVALVVGAIAVALTGPLVATPLVAIATLIGAEFLPTLLSSHRGSSATQDSVNSLHVALFGHAGTPLALQVLLLVVAAVPLAVAARLMWRG